MVVGGKEGDTEALVGPPRAALAGSHGSELFTPAGGGSLRRSDPRAPPVTRSSFRSIDRQVVLGLAAALVVLLSVRGYARSRVLAVDAATQMVDHTHRVMEAVAAADANVVDARLNHRGYLLTGDSAYLGRTRAAARY